MEALAIEALTTEAPATEALVTEALASYGGAGQKQKRWPRFRRWNNCGGIGQVDDGGVLVEDSDVNEGRASTQTQREVTGSFSTPLAVTSERHWPGDRWLERWLPERGACQRNTGRSDTGIGGAGLGGAGQKSADICPRNSRVNSAPCSPSDRPISASRLNNHSVGRSMAKQSAPQWT